MKNKDLTLVAPRFLNSLGTLSVPIIQKYEYPVVTTKILKLPLFWHITEFATAKLFSSNKRNQNGKKPNKYRYHGKEK